MSGSNLSSDRLAQLRAEILRYALIRIENLERETGEVGKFQKAVKDSFGVDAWEVV